MATLNPYFRFDGNCKDAMNFYKDIFGGELNLMTGADSPAADQIPEAYRNAVLHSSLKTADFEIMATDMSQEPYNEGNTVQIALSCKSEQEIHSLFDQLSAGGQVKHPVAPAFFGLFGALTDKYGKHWMLQFNQN